MNVPTYCKMFIADRTLVKSLSLVKLLLPKQSKECMMQQKQLKLRYAPFFTDKDMFTHCL